MAGGRRAIGAAPPPTVALVRQDTGWKGDLGMTARMLRRSPVTVLLLVLLAAMPVLAAAQSAPIEVYRSPEFGYLFWWDASEWTIQEQETDAGSDWVQLANDDTVLDIEAFTAPGVSAQSCLSEWL